jgi:hypothetical protein
MVKTKQPVLINPARNISKTVFFKILKETKTFGKSEAESTINLLLSIFWIDALEPDVPVVIEQREINYTLIQLNSLIGALKVNQLFTAYDAILMQQIIIANATLWGLTSNDLEAC